MNTSTTVSPPSMAAQFDYASQLTQQRFYAGDVIYTEGMPYNNMYVVKEGEVDFYLIREEKKVVVATLGKGQCFGMIPKLLNGNHPTHAAAKTYCELYLIENEKLEAELKEMPQLMTSILRTLAQQTNVVNELIATRVNYQPDVLVYAQLLQLLGAAEVGKAKAESASGPATLASPLLSEVFSSARTLLGHSDVHIRNSLGNLTMLHLVRINDEKGTGKRVTFSPKDIVANARKVASQHKDHGKLDYEYINLQDFAALVEVPAGTLMRKMAGNEFAEDIFTFRKSEIMRLLSEKGRKLFAERRIKSPDEFTDINDIEFADQKSIFEILSRCDVFDLTKLMSTIDEESVRAKIMSNLPRSKQEEIESDLKDLKPADPIEVQQIGKNIIQAIQKRMLKQ